MSYSPNNPNGQATMANSEPVVIASDQSAVPVTVSGVATEATLATRLTESDFDTKTGSLTETAPATDTASSGLNGRLQRIAQRITSLITALGSPFQAGGSIGNTTFGATATIKPNIGSTTVMTVTNLQSLANSATVGWQSDRVSNLSTLATDYEIAVKLTTAAGAPANDKAMYIYIAAWYTTDGGTTWLASSQGTATLPTGTQGASTIASPNNLRILGVLNHTTSAATEQDTYLLSNCFGNKMPDGFSIIIVNYSGVALSTSCIVDYTPLNDKLI